jgi:hypothetical protein
VGRVRLARVASIALLVVGAACSGGKAGTFAVATKSPKPSAAATQQAPKVLPGRIGQPSQARLFAGTNSVPGQLLRYCKNGTCEDAFARSPQYLTARSGSFAMFSIGSAPLAATAEIRTRPSERPSTVTLSPGDLMVFQYGLGAGRYLVDLVVRWRTAEARWRFGLKLTD